MDSQENSNKKDKLFIGIQEEQLKKINESLNRLSNQLMIKINHLDIFRNNNIKAEKQPIFFKNNQIEYKKLNPKMINNNLKHNQVSHEDLNQKDIKILNNNTLMNKKQINHLSNEDSRRFFQNNFNISTANSPLKNIGKGQLKPSLMYDRVLFESLDQSIQTTDRKQELHKLYFQKPLEEKPISFKNKLFSTKEENLSSLKSVLKNNFLKELSTLKTQNTKKNLGNLESTDFKIKQSIYIFSDSIMEKIALTHPSYEKNVLFQKLEFFGDKLLGFEIAKILMEKKIFQTIFAQTNSISIEGQLSVALSELVRKETLAKIGLFLKPHIFYSGTLNDAIIADCLEAWLAAIWIDGGDVSFVINNIFENFIDQKFSKSPKNLIQEFAQEKNQVVEYYYEQKGNLFLVKLKIGQDIVSATGTSKKNAAEKAASLYLESKCA